MDRIFGSVLAGFVAACLHAVVFAGTASAEPPTISVDDAGSHFIHFATPPILDFSRSILVTGDGGVTIAMEVEQDAKGRIRGLGHDTDGSGFDVRHVLTGRVKTSRGLPSLREKTTSQGSLGSDDSTLRGVGLVRGLVHGWGSQAELVGTLRSQICITQPGLSGKPFRMCTRNTAPHTIDLAHAGDWQIHVSLERSGSRVYGAASITTAALVSSLRRTFQVSVDGRVGSDGQAVIDFEPTDANGLGSARIEATLSNDDPPELLAVQGVRGKILGQRFNEVY